MAALAMRQSRPEPSTPPDWIRLQLALAPATSMAELLTAIIETWATQNAHSVTVVEDLRDAAGGARPMDRGLPRPEVYRDASLRDINLKFNDGGVAQILRYDDERPGSAHRDAFNIEHCIAINLFDALDDASTERAKSSIGLAHNLVDFLRHQFTVLEVKLTRQDRISVCPAPPLAGPSVLMQSITHAAVAKHYADTDAYWAAWPKCVALTAGKELVSRGHNVVDAAAYQQSIFAQQWSLARQTTTPDATRYGALLKAAGRTLPPGYQALWVGGADALTGFAYNEAERVLDVTAWTDDGAAVPARDVARLLGWVTNGTFDDGRAVDEVRVTFATREQAVAQARVLLDVGCRVFHYGATAHELVEVTG